MPIPKFRIAGIRLALVAVIFSGLSSGAAAQEIKFVDASGFGNFKVFIFSNAGGLTEIPESDGSFSIPVAELSGKMLAKFAVKYSVPDSNTHSKFTVRNAQKLQVNIEVQRDSSLDVDYTIPIYYFNCIGKCGFDQIDPITNIDADKVFERFFKAAQMTEHYFLRLGTRESDEGQRALKLWRDASYNLNEHKLSWWRMSNDICVVSAETFGADSKDHRATLIYLNKEGCGS